MFCYDNISDLKMMKIISNLPKRHSKLYKIRRIACCLEKKGSKYDGGKKEATGLQ